MSLWKWFNQVHVFSVFEQLRQKSSHLTRWPVGYKVMQLLKSQPMQCHATGIVRQLGLEHWKSHFICLNFSAFSGTWKEFKLYADYSEISGIKPYNSLVRWHCNHGRVQVLSPSLSPCWSSDNHFWRHYQQTIRGFYCRINGWAIGATLPHSLGWSDRQAQTAKLVKSATGSLYWLCSKVIFFLNAL